MRVVCAVHCIAGPALLHQHLFVIVVYTSRYRARQMLLFGRFYDDRFLR